MSGDGLDFAPSKSVTPPSESLDQRVRALFHEIQSSLGNIHTKTLTVLVPQISQESIDVVVIFDNRANIVGYVDPFICEPVYFSIAVLQADGVLQNGMNFEMALAILTAFRNKLDDKPKNDAPESHLLAFGDDFLADGEDPTCPAGKTQ